MLLTRESDYALRILRELAGGDMKTVGDICEEGMVPQQFAYKILKKLEHAGMLVIIRGARGGCKRAENLESFTLFDVMQAVGENKDVNACMCPDYECTWKEKQQRECCVHERLCLLQRKLDAELKSITLADLLGNEAV